MRVALSANRLGRGWGTAAGSLRAGLAELAAAGVDFVEFDLQCSADGVFFVFHDDHIQVDGVVREVGSLQAAELAGHLGEVVRYEVVLEAIASVGLKAHLDFKFASLPAAYSDPGSTAEVAATRMAVAVLGAEQVVVTTRREASVAAVRSWADVEAPGLHVGLSLGRGVGGLGPIEAVRVVWGELFPSDKVERSRATVVVAHHLLARLTLARFARRRGLKLLVWTVDSDRGLRYWLTPGRAWMVTTHRVATAVEVRRHRDETAM